MSDAFIHTDTRVRAPRFARRDVYRRNDIHDNRSEMRPASEKTTRTASSRDNRRGGPPIAAIRDRCVYYFNQEERVFNDIRGEGEEKGRDETRKRPASVSRDERYPASSSDSIAFFDSSSSHVIRRTISD